MKVPLVAVSMVVNLNAKTGTEQTTTSVLLPMAGVMSVL